MRLHRPRYADVAATLALVFAMSGTAYAVTQLDPNSVYTAAIQDGAVTNPKIHANAVKSGTIQNASILAADLAGDAVDGTKVVNESLTSADLGTDSVQATEIADDSIDGGEIVDNSMSSADIGAGAITNSELASNAVDGGKVASESLTLSDLLGANSSYSVAFSVGGNGCAPLVLAASGAQVGQAALLSFTTAAPSGLLFSPMGVTTAGQINGRVCNVTSSSISVSGLGVRVVTFG